MAQYRCGMAQFKGCGVAQLRVRHGSAPDYTIKAISNFFLIRGDSRQFVTSVVDTSGKFATDINNTSKTGGKICHRSLIPGVHFDLRISPRIFTKFEMTLVPFRGLGEDDS
jgi:hypothetical protein